MMTTPSSKTKILLKKLLIAPLVAGFIFAFAQRVEAQEKLPQVVEVKEKLQNENELLIFIKKDGKLNIKNKIVAYNNLKKVLNKEIDDINKAKIILKTDPNAPLRFANLTKIKNALRQNGIYAISFKNFVVSPKDKIIIKNKKWSSKKVRPQVIEVVEQQKTRFHENHYITIDGQKYYYTFDKKERIARYYKNGKLAKLNIVKEYKKKYKIFKRLQNNGKHYVYKTKSAQKVIDREFSDLGGMYFRMPRADKKKVSYPNAPSRPYVTLWKSGQKFYKKKGELTKEDRLLMMPPPPPPNASKKDIRKAKESMKAWRKRTGQKPQIREVKPIKIEVIKNKNGLVEVIETPTSKSDKEKLKEYKKKHRIKDLVEVVEVKDTKVVHDVKELVEVRELKEVQDERPEIMELIEVQKIKEVQEKSEVNELVELKETHIVGKKHQKLVTIDEIKNLTNEEIIELKETQNSNLKKIYYINNKKVSKKKFKHLKKKQIKKYFIKKGKDNVNHIYITLKK